MKYGNKRKAAKLWALPSGKIDNILFSDQNRIRKQAKFTNSPIGKAF